MADKEKQIQKLIYEAQCLELYYDSIDTYRGLTQEESETFLFKVLEIQAKIKKLSK